MTNTGHFRKRSVVSNFVIIHSSKISSFGFDAWNFSLLVYGVRHLIDQRKNPAFTSLQCIESSAPRMDDQVVFKWLAQESYGSACQSPLGCARFVVSRDKN